MTIRTVHLFVFDGLSDWEPSYAIAHLNNPAGQAQPGSLRVRTVAASLAPVLTAGGLRIIPDHRLDSLRPEDSAMLILPGGVAWETGGNREATEKAKKFLAADVPVAAIGGATMGLAGAGLVAANGMAPVEFAREIFNVLGISPIAEPGRQSTRGELGVHLLSDPAGVSVSPAYRRTIVSIHVGTSVHIGCRRGGKYHCGLSVHGDIDIIPPGTTSRWELKKKDTALVLSVPQSLLSMTAHEYGIDPAGVEIVNRFQMRDPQIEHIGWALKMEMESGYRSGKLYFDCLGTAIAACLLDRHSSVSRTMRMYKEGMSGSRLRQVLSHIEDNLERELSLKEIAAVAGLSVSQCTTAFRKSVGMPIHQYVIRRRVDRAQTLLKEGKLSISQIAAEAGFAQQSHLAYHVRRLLGVSPLSLRDNRRSDRKTAC
jgi:AraC family transcriptional regulator